MERWELIWKAFETKIFSSLQKYFFGCQSWGLGVGKIGEGGQKIQISSYKS